MTATSFGKIILSGEHAAVYGQPAVAASIHLKIQAQLQKKSLTDHSTAFIQNLFLLFEQKYQVATTEFSLTLTGDLPVGSNLGSSAAAAHASFLALAEQFHITLTDEEMIALIQEAERFAHGHPSGLDAVTVVKKGVVEFQRQEQNLQNFHYASLPNQAVMNTPFFLIQSGRPLESTKEMIEMVRQKYSTKAVQQIIAEIGKITTQLISDLEKNTLNFDWISPNERYLEELGIVGVKVQEMIHQIEKNGGVAKATGGGGYQQGSGILLAYHPDPQKLESLINQENWKYYQTQLGAI